MPYGYRGNMKPKNCDIAAPAAAAAPAAPAAAAAVAADA
jgi:hypothetical protein